MDIQANNIVLDCQGHIIDGIDTENTYGIYVYRSSPTTTNITIKNCVLTDWYYGIIFYNSNSNILSNITSNSNSCGIILSSNSNTLSNITTNSNTNYGIRLISSNSNTLSNITTNSNTLGGISIEASNSNTLSNITSNSNYYGISIEASNSNTIKNSIIQGNFYGIYIYEAGENLIYNNLFNNTYNFFFGRFYQNYWNTSYQEGENIWDASLGYIGGNFWTNPDDTGYSDTCHDTNADGFCDDPYVLATDNIDYLPIAKTVGQYSCVEPYEGMVIDKDTTFCRGTYYLNFTTMENSIRFSNPNVKVYCNETVFIGNNTPDSIAIFIDMDDVTITKTDDASFGCKFSNYRFGISILPLIANSVVEYVDIDNIEENGEAGVFVQGGTNFTIRHIKGYNSRETVDVRGNNNYGTVYDVYCHNMTGWGCVVTGFNPPQNLTLNLGDVTCEDNKCVSVIWANDLALNCFGSINGNGGGVGIYVKESSGNLWIDNCTVANSTLGIQVENSDSITIKDSKVYYSSQFGISIFGGSNNLLENIETYYTAPESAGLAINSDNMILRNIYTHNEYRSLLGGTNNTLEYSRCENVSWGCWHILGDNTTVRHNEFPSGISLLGSSYGEIYNNTIGDGIEIRDWNGVSSSYNEIYNNYIYKETPCGISLTNSNDNLIYNNIINVSQTPVCFGDTVYANQWNTARRSGTRIYSNGTEIGGNYWTNPDGTGYSDTCEDSNKDGFCDQPYVLAENNTDYLPLSDEYMPFVPAPRLYQLSPIAGILAYVLLPIVFALVAQKYLLGEVELTLQGLIKYLLMFVMIIIVAIGFAYVFSVL
jgi:parallel beta-helix repeat protein